ncbi:Alpha/Beta hydrolase protein [Gymnopilus junonius]|uniref:Alpha/Beta hydrolase protein n=1 Tax=Gymnopilus junonius TaxID=109634 RepID=A0A9P5TMQ1_GYMJU|nr:Alpha/Beta hydrolase protein [Gymnopilus junonius]
MPLRLNTLTVSPGVDLAYTDSGAPNVFPYSTIFAVHGICFTNLIFQKLQSVAFDNGFRFVAVNRRSYAGSTPFSPEETKVIVDDAPLLEERANFIQARGHELALFIALFAQKFELPPLSDDGKTGGSTVYGWSMGSQLAVLMLASVPTLPPTVRSSLASHLRSLVIYDAAPYFFGFPNAEKNWAPLVDITMPESLRLPMFGQWVSSYFDNGDYSKHNYDTLAYVLPSTDKIPTIFKDDMSNTASYGQDAALDLPLVFKFVQPLQEAFYKALRGSETAALFPRLKMTFVCGDRSPSFGLSGLWTVQDNVTKGGLRGRIHYKIVKGANHFLHWEDPYKALELITADVVNLSARL